MSQNEPTYYGDYLELPKILDAQKPLSKKFAQEAHDETLFIVVHQVYELWFKQILHEIGSIVNIFKQNPIPEKDLQLVNSRLERVLKIQGVLLDQIPILETMTPMDFLEFRNFLYPASGFQSVQFRELEIMLGLPTHNRYAIDREFFLGRLSERDRSSLEQMEKTTPLITLLEQWLERLPFTQGHGFDFWQEYRSAVENMLRSDRELIKNNPSLSEKEKVFQLENHKSTEETFKTLLDEKLYEERKKKGDHKLSRQATLNALFILLYRDEPIFHNPHKLLLNLLDMDESFTTWRYRHAMLAHRMLGTKIGTGGSSGYEYLKRAAEKNRVFLDLFNLSTFIIPKSSLPKLPNDLRKKLNFL